MFRLMSSRSWIVVSIIAITCGISLGVVFYSNLRGENGELAQLDVKIDDWVNALRKYNVKVVYPPQEGVQVGDLFAILGPALDKTPATDETSREWCDQTRASGGKRSGTIVSDVDEDESCYGVLDPKRSVKIGHVPSVSQLLKAEYEKTIQFEDRAPGATSPVMCKEQGCFEPVTRTRLPIAVFSDLSVSSSMNTNRSANISAPVVGGDMAGSQKKERSATIKIPEGYVYGVSSWRAASAMDDFCGRGVNSGRAAVRPETETSVVCEEVYVRKRLEDVLGREATEGSTKYTYTRKVRLYVVTYIYQASSLSYQLALQSEFGLKLSIASKFDKLINSPAGQNSGDGTSSVLGTLSTDQKQQVQNLLRLAAGIDTSSAFSVSSAGNAQIVIDRQLVRPVTFGFQAIRVELAGSNRTQPKAPNIEVAEPEAGRS